MHVKSLSTHESCGTRRTQHSACPGSGYPNHRPATGPQSLDHQSALGTLVERTTRTVLLVRLPAHDAVSVRKAFARKLRHVPKQMRLSLTYDRGKEMTEHQLFSRDTQMKVYFAHPQSPWERGINENTNGLIRQYFPKGTDFNEVSAYQIRKVRTG